MLPGFCACARCTVHPPPCTSTYNKHKHVSTWSEQAKLFLFQLTFDKLSCPSWSCIQTWSAGEQSCRKRALLAELLTDSSVSLLSAELFRAWRPHLPQTHAHTQTKQTDTPCGSSALRNMFFARLQQIKFPSKWISSLAAFGGRTTLFSLIFILYPPNKWSTVQPALCDCLRRVFDFLFRLLVFLAGKFGLGNGKLSEKCILIY